MIQFIRAEHIDRTKWDHCVSTAHNKSVFGMSWLLDSVCDQWHGLVVGDYESIQPLPSKTNLGFIHTLYQPFFTRTLPIYSKVDLNKTEVAVFFNEIQKRFQRVLMGFPNSDYVPSKLKKEALVYQELYLSKPHDSLRAGFSKNAKRLIKKAENQNLKIAKVESKEVVRLFRDSVGHTIKELKDKNVQQLQSLMDVCLKQGCGLSYGAFDSNTELCAAAFFIIDHDRVFYLKGGTNQKGRELGGMFLIFNEVIRTHAGQLKQFDFGGSNISSIAEFYKKFGAIDHNYLFLSKKLF